MEIEHVKKQFELVKDTETFVITTQTVKWLIDEVEKRDRLIKENQELKDELTKYVLLYANEKDFLGG